MDNATNESAAVSVLIPTYNRADLLPATLNSILSQRHPADEIIVVDDGSTDDTEAVCAAFLPRIQYHRIANSGVCRARDVAASFATSPYIAFSDSDDLWREDKLEKQLALHLQHPEVEYSFTNFAIVTDSAWSEKTKFEDAPEGYFARCDTPSVGILLCEEPFYDRLLFFQPIFPSTTMMTRDFYHRIGGYKDFLGRVQSEDLEFALRCALNAPIGIVTEPVVGIRKHTSNFSGNEYAVTCGEIEILKYALANHPISESTRKLVLDQIALRSIDAAYGPFRGSDFATFKSLLSEVPGRFITPKLRLKLLIANSPAPIGRALKNLLTRA